MRRFTNIVLSLSAILLLSGSLLAKEKKYTVSGVVQDPGGEKVKAAEVVLLDSASNELDRVSTGKRLRGKGKFEFKKVTPGQYVVQATKEDVGTATEKITVTEDDVELMLTLEKEGAPVVGAAAAAAEEVPERMPEEGYVLTELSFELKKLTAELGHQGSQIRELQAKSEMWVNPLSMYGKEIILENGSTIFGKIVYQDEEMLKVETLVGYLVIDRDQVVRIIENVIGQEEPEYIPEQLRETYSPPPMPRLAEPHYVSAEPSERIPSKERAANVVLVGNISEKKDKSNNITFSGQVKNIGGRRADFVKVNFVFRKNWSGETQTLTTFAVGTYHTFDSGITTDSSLLPGATGSFELVVSASFGPFIGYSYTIDWEEYE